MSKLLHTNIPIAEDSLDLTGINSNLDNLNSLIKVITIENKGSYNTNAKGVLVITNSTNDGFEFTIAKYTNTLVTTNLVAASTVCTFSLDENNNIVITSPRTWSMTLLVIKLA